MGYIHFYTDWCGYCQKMDNETFSDTDVVESLHNNFVSIKINAENNPDIARKFGADRFPFNWFVNKQTEPVGRQPGFIPAETMVHILGYLASGKYEKMEFNNYLEQKQK